MIIDKNSRDQKLRVPKAFLEKYGDHLSYQIHFKLPSGSEWNIKLRRCSGKVWFEKGWQEFSEFYSLEYGNCLVFRYEGNSKFHVLIIDESDTEIKYPITESQIEEIDEEDDEYAESSEYFPHSSSKSSSSSSSSVRVANQFVSSHPFFKVTLGPSLKMHVPVSFGKHFTLMENQLVMLWVGDRSWLVRLIFHPLNDRFSAGWVAFAKENWLKEGDVCVFEPIDTNNLAFVVNIFRC